MPEADEKERKQRRTTSELIDQSSPAFRIVQKGGGLSKFARDFDFPVSTVQGWIGGRKERGGSGLIPSRTRFVPEVGREVSYQEWIMLRGRQLDPPIDFAPEDFVWPPLDLTA